ncbi:MAG: hypothetical protein ACW99Q_04295 [Candidatus Kariarchaeaceae archaeon]
MRPRVWNKSLDFGHQLFFLLILLILGIPLVGGSFKGTQPHFRSRVYRFNSLNSIKKTLYTDTVTTEHYNVTFNVNTNFNLNNGEMLIFNQCRSEFEVQINFYGNGSLLFVNSEFYYNLYDDFLDIVIMNCTVAFTKINGNCQALLTKSIFQHYLANDDTTTKLFHCNAQKIYAGYPDSTGFTGTMIKASSWAKIIMMGNESQLFVNLYTTGLAGIIWYIRNPWESENPQVPILDGNVSMDFYIEGFIRSENVTVQFYVDETLEQEFEVDSYNTWGNWYIESYLNITKYPVGNHTLKLFVNGSLTHNGVYLPLEFVNIHKISLPQIVYPNRRWEKLSGVVTVDWQTSLDSHNHDLSYSLYVQRLGYAWELLAKNLTFTTYEWDTSSFVYDMYILKVVTECSEGLLMESETSSVFTIENIGNGPPPSTEPSNIDILPEWTIRFGLFVSIVVILLSSSYYFAKKRR